jgi:ABC-type Mn2+/Zn2+ transport system permease subunit
LISARAVVGSMIGALWVLFSGLFATVGSVRPISAFRFWTQKMGSIDEPLGSSNGIPPWFIAVLVLVLVAAVVVLAVIFLVPPGPPPYT